MDNLAKVTLTTSSYQAIQALVERGDEIQKRFQQFKKNEAIIVKKFWKIIPYESYNIEGLRKEFKTDLTFTLPSFVGEREYRWNIHERSNLILCRELLKFKPHEECYLNANTCAALQYALECCENKEAG